MSLIRRLISWLFGKRKPIISPSITTTTTTVVLPPLPPIPPSPVPPVLGPADDPFPLPPVHNPDLPTDVA